MHISPWTCPSCATMVRTPHCPTCGERYLSRKELSLRHLLQQATHAITSVDGRLARSFRAVALSPGMLTTAYMEGRRKPYIGPFQLFLIANICFFAVQSFTGNRTFSTPLESHLHQQDWSEWAQQLVSRHLTAAHLNLAQYAPAFDQAIAVNAKSLIIVMAVPFAFLVAVVFSGRRLPIVCHAVFALHFYTFLLLALCIASAAVAVDRLLGGSGLGSALFDHVISAVLLAACAIYLYVAIGRVYASKRLMRLLQAMALAAAVAVIFLGYRLALLPITLWTT